MYEVLVILQLSITAADREAVMRVTSPTQSISNRVFVAEADPSAISRIRSMRGVASVLTNAEPAVQQSHRLDDTETLFVEAWMSRLGKEKKRPGDNLDWDTPPMQPPDHE
jgi:hypothetical protein